MLRLERKPSEFEDYVAVYPAGMQGIERLQTLTNLLNSLPKEEGQATEQEKISRSFAVRQLDLRRSTLMRLEIF